MQRAKHADRKRRTRALILIGSAVERAGADHLPPDEVAAVLAHYVATGGEPKLQAFVAKHLSTSTEDRGGGSAAPRRERSGVGGEVPLSEIIQ